MLNAFPLYHFFIKPFKVDFMFIMNGPISYYHGYPTFIWAKQK